MYHLQHNNLNSVPFAPLPEFVLFCQTFYFLNVISVTMPYYYYYCFGFKHLAFRDIKDNNKFLLSSPTYLPF